MRRCALTIEIDEETLIKLLITKPRIIDPYLTRCWQEYPLKGGYRLDILCRRSGNWVALEIKTSAGNLTALNQLKNYMSLLQKKPGIKGKIQGILVARHIPNDLILYLQKILDSIELYEFSTVKGPPDWEVKTRRVFPSQEYRY